ncbi:TMEM175 family protein [Maribacter sp. 2-571]|uniref:TMEM175 family protein n=1 Tax=Maribacter sp. 2-571 TaxID=3417569 RepID=UPI003D346710
MRTERLETFTDGVLAIVITIMVLNFQAPSEVEFVSLLPLLPNFFSYILSFVYLGIFWSNHHHLLRIAKRVNGKILWANLHLLFWLSLIPFGASWIGESGFARNALILYGIILLGSSFSFWLLVNYLAKTHAGDDAIVKLHDGDNKGKYSMLLFVVGIGVTYFFPILGCIVYLVNTAIWFFPNRKVEKIYNEEE